MNRELLHILENIEREKGIKRDVLFEAIESALMSAARKVVGKKREREDVTVQIDRETGEIKVMSAGEAIKSAEFGRIAAQTAKQVIIQKIREAEREVIYDDFHDRVNTLCTGSVHRFEKGNLIIDLGRTEGILPRRELCPRESFKQGDRVRAYILNVEKSPRGPQITMSRTHPNFVKKLFGLEVPEIDDGIVEIKDIAREAGERTKMSVHSKEEKIDSVGACVGMRGQRVKNIVRELGGERIDIIRWREDIKEYIKASMSPAEIKNIGLDRKKHQASILVADDQLSLAIGKQGQNVRLASKLTGWNIDILSESDYTAITEISLRELNGVGKKAEEVLVEAGFDNVAKIAESSVETLTQLEGIGAKSAGRMIESAKALLKDKKARKSREKKAAMAAEKAKDEAAKAEKPEAAGAGETEAEPQAGAAPEYRKAVTKDAETKETAAAPEGGQAGIEEAGAKPGGKNPGSTEADAEPEVEKPDAAEAGAAGSTGSEAASESGQAGSGGGASEKKAADEDAKDESKSKDK